ncbi:hypothetical protein [Leptolyngbya sp. PCC 6406]|uniref:hypothetical protein n=1 Tax=Leptolyngbya sp. PCC 6406 TaxID=1173264 RepID=UPI001CEC9ECD
MLVLGVFLGSALWWCLLSMTINLFRARITPTTMEWLNRVAGTVILAFGVVTLAVSP